MFIDLVLIQGGGKGEPLVSPVSSNRTEVVVINTGGIIEVIGGLVE